MRSKIVLKTHCYIHISAGQKSAEKHLSFPFSLFKAEFHYINHPTLPVNSFKKKEKKKKESKNGENHSIKQTNPINHVPKHLSHTASIPVSSWNLLMLRQ